MNTFIQRFTALLVAVAINASLVAAFILVRLMASSQPDVVQALRRIGEAMGAPA